MAPHSRKRVRRGATAGVVGAARPSPSPSPAGRAPDETGSARGGETAGRVGGPNARVGETGDHPSDPVRRLGAWRVEPPVSRSERRNAEIRAGLTPLAPGERPPAVLAAAAVAAILGLTNLIAFLAGARIAGRHPGAAGIGAFSFVMLVCAVGLWRLWYGAVLGFMALLAITACVFTLLAIEASNLLGLVVALAAVVGAGYLFFKLVRVLSRIQMPRR